MSNEDLLLACKTLGDDRIQIFPEAQKIIKSFHYNGELLPDVVEYLNIFFPYGWWKYRNH